MSNTPDVPPVSEADAVAVVDGLRAALAAVDPSGSSPRVAEDLLAATVGVINAAWALAGRAAAHIDRTQAFRRCGDRTAAHHLGRVAGVGLGTAKAAIEVTDAVASLAATRQAWRDGELSTRQANAIASAAGIDPGAEARLLRLAKVRGIAQLEEECARVRAVADPADQAERHRRARRRRGAWKHTNPDGSAEVRFRSSNDDVAEVWNIVGAFRHRLFRHPHPAGIGGNEDGRPSFDQQSADAFLEMCRTAASAGGLGRDETVTGRTAKGGPGTGGPGWSEPTLPLDGLEPTRAPVVPKKVIVRIDLAALLRGYPTSGEVCDIPGFGPIPVSAVHDMLATGDPFLAAVITKGSDVATVAHLGRKPSAFQQTGLEWLDPRCRAEGCDRTIGLERDHRVDWAATEVTLLGWLEWLCSHHHRLKTDHGWRLVHGKGIRSFVAPDDPRHPNHSPPARGSDRASAGGPGRSRSDKPPSTDDAA